jgi:integrase
VGKKRRSSGEGHVRWNAKLGVYEARLYVPVKLRHLYGGKRVVPFYSKKEAVALEKRDAAKREMEEGRSGSRGLSFGAYLAGWLEALSALNAVSGTTLSDYRYYAERHLIPADKLGNVPLADLTAQDLDHLYSRLSTAGLGSRAVNHVHSVARAALQRAVKKRLISYNPARDADPPTYSTSQREYATLSMEEVARFFEAAKGDRYEAFFVTAVLSGARPAELRALSWEDVTLPDNGEGAAVIRRTVSQDRTGPPYIRNTTKTGKPRTIPLLTEVVTALKAHRAQQNEERLKYAGVWKDHGLIFANATGGIADRDNLAGRHLKPILRRAGLSERTRIYDLRHTFGTLWNSSGGNIKFLQEVMGHARIETTMNMYVHPTDQDKNRAMNRFGRFLGNRTNTNS